ncbi:YifB family Mg chelatase-like AAA ATPase [Dermatobacter hominis]|uniref:YifB family Mg chelatase-like AAA ATPase n=1 Tax=Dermatobacter hominis TaxID=2884263 RepID=UPI001D10ADB2|nr:YifB family Mg chelatase-like AAA ATPase [Dermatobacter hominis]UDY36869.1 YifB family Mg chelatase-like AAA ATPase [Dermatobacter hominis]
MLATARSATLLGVRGHPVQVEAHVSEGLPAFTIVGLPDTSCRESRDRVRAAMLSSRFVVKQARVTVNLAPTNLRKVGAGLDVAMALALLAATGQIEPTVLDGHAFIGELGLDGSLRGVVGMLPLCEAVGELRPVVPHADAAEASLVRPDVRCARTLRELVLALQGEEPWPDAEAPSPPVRSDDVPDLADVQGQVVARRALEVAAAGGHHLLMVGPPGGGKTMLAERLPGLLPDLSDEAALDVSRVHSAAGVLQDAPALLRRPPLRAPHHTASLVALVGGGSAVLRPGEISLASGGVLFLDELGEFPAAHLDALRQPLESGVVRVARAHVGATLPARFLLVGATNPCPCGAGPFGACRCSAAQVQRYLRRLSGPLLDRFDLGLWVDPPPASEVLGQQAHGEPTAVVRARVEAARELARRRGVSSNRQLRGAALERAAPLGPDALSVLRDRLAAGRLTMRGAQRVRAVALTLMDLDGVSGPLDAEHVHVALSLRTHAEALGVAA